LRSADIVPMLACLQLALASVDAMLAGTVMYVLLPADLHLSYEPFLGIYLIAAVVSVLSLVPGGLGVFEAMVTSCSYRHREPQCLAPHRVIYFLLPLAVVIACFAAHGVSAPAAQAGGLSRISALISSMEEDQWRGG
jgi:phosphatidylglycerol lysyltransferase